MSSAGMSRRTMFGAGTAVLAGAALLAESENALAAPNEAIVREWYRAWDNTKNWDQADALSTADFTFTSPNDDDHISKAVFKKRCWDTQIAFIKTFDLELVMAQGDDVLVKYTCHTANGKSFSNVEYFRMRNGQIASLRCFFGGKMTYPSSVSRQ
jgi:ketosteroid isomerase-like protein